MAPPLPPNLRSQVVPFWEDLTAKMEEDKEMTKALGWVREMYDFSVALVAAGLKLELDTEKTSPFIAHLPGVSNMGEAHAFHYTLVGTGGGLIEGRVCLCDRDCLRCR